MANKYTRTIVAEKLEELNRLQDAYPETSERQLIEKVGILRGTAHQKTLAVSALSSSDPVYAVSRVNAPHQFR